jgi:glycosyltransferase 2 family protein
VASEDFAKARRPLTFKKPVKKWAPLLFQSLVSIALLVWIFWKEDFRSRTWQVLTSAHPGWLAAGFLAAGAGNVVGVLRWGIFLRVLGISLAPWDVLRMSFVGLFFNTFLVGAVGGDAVKVVWLAAKGERKTAALLSVLMDRMSGFGALIVSSFVFMILRLDWLMRSAVVAGLIKAVFAYLFVVVVLMAISFLMSAKGLTSRLPRRFPLRKMIIEFTEAYLQFVIAWRQTLLASLLSVIMLLAYFFTFYLSARAFGLHVPVVEFFAFMPAVDIISALPISLGGFGVREQLFVTLLGDLWAVPAAQAVSISLGGALLSMLWGLCGLALLPAYHDAARRVLQA